jgi:hypothetical protein
MSAYLTSARPDGYRALSIWRVPDIRARRRPTNIRRTPSRPPIALSQLLSQRYSRFVRVLRELRDRGNGREIADFRYFRTFWRDRCDGLLNRYTGQRTIQDCGEHRVATYDLPKVRSAELTTTHSRWTHEQVAIPRVKYVPNFLRVPALFCAHASGLVQPRC